MTKLLLITYDERDEDFIKTVLGGTGLDIQEVRVMSEEEMAKTMREMVTLRMVFIFQLCRDTAKFAKALSQNLIKEIKI